MPQNSVVKKKTIAIDDIFVKRVMATLKNSGKLNLKANESNTYGLVIYPR